MSTAILTCLLSLLPAADHDVLFVVGDAQIEIKLGGEPFATYVFRDEKTLRPYMAHVRAPGGTQVTRNHPPVPGVDATDHDTFHPGIWLAFGDLSGADFWRNKATVKHAGFAQRPAADAAGGSFTVNNEYRAGDKLICREQCRIAVRPGPDRVVILWDSRFWGDDDFYFGDQEEMGLGIRVATLLAVKNGGQMTNSDGLKNEKQIWGKQAAWCNLSGTIDGRPVGVLVVPDAKNFRRSWFHARDYGFVAANPFGVNAFTKGPKSKVTVAKGDTLRLRFAVVVHAGAIDSPATATEVQSLMNAEQ